MLKLKYLVKSIIFILLTTFFLPLFYLLTFSKYSNHGYGCDGCRKSIALGKQTHSCRGCNFDICQACYEGKMVNGSESPTKKKVDLYLPICNKKKELLFVPKLTLLESQKENTFICVSKNGVAFRNTVTYGDRYKSSNYPKVNLPNHPLEVVMGDGK